MSGPAILVLGATGPSGICVLRELIHRGQHTITFVRNPAKVPQDLSENPLLEVIKGELSDFHGLSAAVARSSAIISLLGPASLKVPDPTLYASFYAALFPIMSQHKVRRILAMGTVSDTLPQDHFSLLRWAFVAFLRLAGPTAYQTILSITRAFESAHKDVDWTIFRLFFATGESDADTWRTLREQEDVFAGYIGEPGWTTSIHRAALAKWLVAEALEGTGRWIHGMPCGITPPLLAMMPTPEQAPELINIYITDESASEQSIDRTNYNSFDVLKEVWTGLGLPETSLASISLPGEEGPALPSSFKIGILGQASIGLSALTAAEIHALGNKSSVPRVTVPLEHAVIEYKSERLYTVSDELAAPSGGAIGGLHKTSDGYVRIHDGFPNHVQGTLHLLGLKTGATRQQVSEQTANWASIDLENCGTAEGKVAIYALRSYRQWDKLPQSRAISNFPISIKQVSQLSPTGLPRRMQPGNLKCLQGLRVVEMSRVIAAPLCGKTLAAHGAEVIWVTSPTLPDLPRVDREFGRGKKTVQLDIHNSEDRKQLLNLLKDCDVFVQGYRPGSLASYGLSQDQLRKINPTIIVANMSAFGPEGPWSGRRGFDSLVQTCSGMNVSEAEHAEKGEAARPTPCQALDHSGGYMLAVGVMAAVYHRAVKGGSWRVDVSLAGMMKYLRSLGQYPGASGFEARDFDKPEDVPEGYFEIQETGFGTMRSIKHSATIEGLEVGWDIMPKPLGSDKPAWD
ncbi:Formyl-coenzyme A transferase [Fusarium circinatum]|uniref:Formyl-coenzyme A transferase n=1 Tax=Fusarium circinatum TaxID=48490 RepID=A0A8H5TLA2_FUSCI|nr:Formyl-coenzyme A transferase [Fusarium circinatum]